MYCTVFLVLFEDDDDDSLLLQLSLALRHTQLSCPVVVLCCCLSSDLAWFALFLAAASNSLLFSFGLSLSLSLLLALWIESMSLSFLFCRLSTLTDRPFYPSSSVGPCFFLCGRLLLPTNSFNRETMTEASGFAWMMMELQFLLQ